MHDKPIAAGRSSFDLVDREALMQSLDLKPGELMLDVASGAGNYTLEIASNHPDVKVFAIDLWNDGVAELLRRASAAGLSNVRAEVSDVSKRIPMEDAAADACLVATALHDLAEEGGAEGTLGEIARVLKAGGRLVVVEFNKVEGPPGPPRHIRLSPEELDSLVLAAPFTRESSREAGDYTYVSVYSRKS